MSSAVLPVAHPTPMRRQTACSQQQTRTMNATQVGHADARAPAARHWAMTCASSILYLERAQRPKILEDSVRSWYLPYAKQHELNVHVAIERVSSQWNRLCSRARQGCCIAAQHSGAHRGDPCPWCDGVVGDGCMNVRGWVTKKRSLTGKSARRHQHIMAEALAPLPCPVVRRGSDRRRPGNSCVICVAEKIDFSAFAPFW